MSLEALCCLMFLLPFLLIILVRLPRYLCPKQPIKVGQVWVYLKYTGSPVKICVTNVASTLVLYYFTFDPCRSSQLIDKKTFYRSFRLMEEPIAK